MADRRTDDNIAQFCSITGASTKDAKKLLDKYKRLDVAIDAYYGESSSASGTDKQAVSTAKLNSLFDKYKDPDGTEITIDGTLKLCEDLKVDPEDVVLLAVAFELKSPRIGAWTKQGWVQGWKNLGCGTIQGMQSTLVNLKDKLASDSTYFKKVYNYTFEFGRQEGQRSLSFDSAQEFWKLLLPHGMTRGALTRKSDGEDVDMAGEGGWEKRYTQWWFDFLAERGAKGVSKDVWVMFLEFVRSIDSQFSNYDTEGAWPSTIDDFVEYAKKRLGGQ